MRPLSNVIGSPASRVLRSGLSNAKVGADGEGWTALALQDFAERHPEAVVAHSLSIPGSNADIDHIVVIGDHITVIDSKLWSSNRKYHVLEHDSSVVASFVPDDEGRVQSFKHFPISTNWQTDQVRAMFGKHTVTGVLCVHGHDGRLPAVTNDVHPRSLAYIPVLSRHHLVKRLEYTCRRQQVQTVSDEIIDRLIALTA